VVRRGAISGLANNRLKARQIRWNPDPLSCNLDSERLAEVDRLLRHLLRRPEHLMCLFLGRSPAVDLGACLLICSEHVEARGCSKRCLAVLARHLDVCLAKPPQPILLAHPPPDATEDELLPWLQADVLPPPRPLALGVLEQLDEAADVFSARRIEAVRERLRLRCLELRQVTFARANHPLARSDLP